MADASDASAVLRPEPASASGTAVGPSFLTTCWAGLAVGLATVVALVLRLLLAGDSLLGDELFMYQIVDGRSLGDALHVVHETEKTPPLFFVLVWAAAKLGDPVAWLRAPSIAFGTALVPVVYLLGRATVGRVAGVVAAAMVALDPFAIFYGTEARAYGALAFLAGLSTLCLLLALRSNRRLWWAAYVLAVLAVLYTHYMGVFVLGVQALWAFAAHRERLRELLVAHGLVVVGFAPWIPSFFVQAGHSGDEARRIAAVAPPSLSYWANIDVQMLLGHPFVPLRHLPGSAAVALALVVIGAATAAGLARAWPLRPRWGSPIVLLGLLAVASPVGVALISLPPDHSFMLARNLGASLPALALLAARVLVTLRQSLAVPAVAAVLAVLLVGAIQTLQPGNRRSNYRGAARFIDARGHPGDPVVQAFLLSNGGALGRVTSINFDRPRPHYVSGTPAEARAWARGRRGARVFVVYGLAGIFKGTRHLGAVAGPGKAFVRVAEARWTGLETVLVGEYRYRGA